MLMDGMPRAAGAKIDRWLALVLPALVTSQLLLFAAALFLCARRASGAIEHALPVLLLAVTAVGLLLWAVVLRGLTGASHTNWLPTAIIVLFAVACSYPASRAVDWLVWLPILALDRWSQRTLAATAPRLLPAGIALHPERPFQQITRFRTRDGNDVIRGTLVAEFTAGERNATVYAAFCPPFEQLPMVQAHIADNSAATVKVAQQLHNGIQFDVRLTHPATTLQNVAIEFFAAATNTE